jgi:dsDNA-binding SOS-regulon protein
VSGVLLSELDPQSTIRKSLEIARSSEEETKEEAISLHKLKEDIAAKRQLGSQAQQEQLSQYLFDHRNDLVTHFKDLYSESEDDPSLLTNKDFIGLFLYS